MPQFNMPRPRYPHKFIPILERAIERQELSLKLLSKKQQKQLSEVCKAIKEKGIPSYIVVKKLPGKLGSGLFLHPKADPLERGSVIGSYAGKTEIVTQNEFDDSAYAFEPLCDITLKKSEQALVDKKHAFHPSRKYSLKVDAEKMGNFIRYINHCDQPNVIAECVEIHEDTLDLDPTPIEVIYFAKKKIHPGEQLLVNYEDETDSYWGALGIKPFPMTPKTFKLDTKLNLVGPAR